MLDFFPRHATLDKASKTTPQPPNPPAPQPPHLMSSIQSPPPRPPRPYADSPAQAELEALPAPQHSENAVLRFTCPEFTTLCPRSGLPDFAKLIIDYTPKKFILESKSLKLFLMTFRDHNHFHEDCTLLVAKKIEHAIRPRWLRIGGYWYPRGGIPIDVFYQTGVPPAHLWVPPQDGAVYHPRS